MSLPDALSCRKWARAGAIIDSLTRTEPGEAAQRDIDGKFPLHIAAEADAPEELAAALRAVYPPAASRPDSTGRLPSENAARRLGPVHAYLPLTINGIVDL